MNGLLAFDLGTSGVKCSLYDSDGNLLGAEYGEYETFYPQADFREQRPKDWIEKIIEAVHSMEELLSKTKICGIGVSGHSLGALPIDVNGELLTERIPIWSDARAREQANRFFANTDYRTWYECTGNGFPAELYSLFKIMWYQDHEPEVYEKAVKFIGTKDYVNLFLTGKAVTDISYASGCGLYDLKNGTYVEKYAEVAGVDLQKFPDIYPSSVVIGYVTEEAAKILRIPAGIPVVAGGVDNACMSLGAGCFEEGDVYASLGSSAWITPSTGEAMVDYDSRIYTFAHCVPGQFLPSIGIFASGSALAWAADQFFTDITGKDRFDRIGALAEKSKAGANGLLFNPCMAGGSSFDKSPNIRGALLGLSLEHTKEDVARAVMEGIALHLYLSSGAMERSGKIKNRLLVVGGGAKGAVNRQIYADVFGKEVAVSKVKQDAASLGAAALAAVGSGIWESFLPLRRIHGEPVVVQPNKENHQYYQAILPVYRKICDACAELGDQIINYR